jgi:hypothetical protein
VRRSAAAKAQAAERRLVVGGLGAAMGFLEGRGTLPVEILNVPSKLAIGLIATFGEANTSGTTRRMLGALADTSLAVYGYQAAKTKNFIAGEEYVGADDEDEL